jgi:phospholipid N-methyltransferase
VSQEPKKVASDNPIAFFKQTIKDFRNTGALAPSGRFLARGIAECLPDKVGNDYRIIEIGPGTGSVTSELAKRMNGHGHLDLWEISPEFCALLNKRIAEDPMFEKMRDRIRVHEGDVRKLKNSVRYDAVVSGLPLNNFEPDEVAGFLEYFRSLLKPDGLLIWFEYIAIRKLQTPFVGKEKRRRLKGVEAVVERFVKEHHSKKKAIPINLPPARIWQLKFK